MTQILEGRTAAGAIRSAAAVRAARVAEARGRAPTLAAVAIDPGPDTPLFFDVKARAFSESSAAFQPHILPHGSTHAQLLAQIEQLNTAADVDGIYLQYPLPADISDQATFFAAIAPPRDVDGATWGAQNGGPFPPATAKAVIALLDANEIEFEGARVCIVRGDESFAASLATLFGERNADAVVVDIDSRRSGAAIHSADVVVVATGRVNGVHASAFGDRTVAVDVGYYHGGARGDICAHPDDVARLRAFAPPTGCIGPLTVAILIEHTVTAAERAAGHR